MLKNRLFRLCSAALLTLLTAHSTAADNSVPGEEIIDMVMSMGVAPAPTQQPRGSESEGPFEHLVIKNAYMIDGAGAPAQGPVTIEIENDRIVSVHSAGTGSLHLGGADYDDSTKVIDAAGKYVLPGFIDAHIHYGTPSHAFTGSLTDPNYVGKLFLAHGITTVRDAGALMGLGWTLDLKERSDRGEIAAPRIKAHALFPESTSNVKDARQWVRAVEKRGADGIKFIGSATEAIKAGIQEAQKLGLKTMFHHAQTGVLHMNALDTAGA